jgi:hypothetical protein
MAPIYAPTSVNATISMILTAGNTRLFSQGASQHSVECREADHI